MEIDKKQPERKLLLLGFGLVIVLFIVTGVTSIISIRTLVKLTLTIHKHPLEVSNAALHASMGVVKIHRSMKDVALSETVTQLDQAIEAVKLEEVIVYENLDIVKRNILGAEGQALEAETRKLFTNWRPIREEVIKLVSDGQRAVAASITKEKGANHQAMVAAKMLSLRSYARRKADGFLAQAEMVQRKVIISTLVMVAAGVLLTAFFSILANANGLQMPYARARSACFSPHGLPTMPSGKATLKPVRYGGTKRMISFSEKDRRTPGLHGSGGSTISILKTENVLSGPSKPPSMEQMIIGRPNTATSARTVLMPMLLTGHTSRVPRPEKHTASSAPCSILQSEDRRRKRCGRVKKNSVHYTRQ